MRGWIGVAVAMILIIGLDHYFDGGQYLNAAVAMVDQIIYWL